MHYFKDNLGNVISIDERMWPYVRRNEPKLIETDSMGIPLGEVKTIPTIEIPPEIKKEIKIEVPPEPPKKEVLVEVKEVKQEPKVEIKVDPTPYTKPVEKKFNVLKKLKEEKLNAVKRANSKRKTKKT